MSDREEPLILSIETATRAGGVAVSKGSRLLAARTGDATRSHSTDLLQHIQEAIEEAGCRLQEVEVFAAALGPGSFTGLRIGVATVKSLASTLERTVVGVPTLAAVAHTGGHSAFTVALLPAGRGEVFAQTFRVEEDGETVPLDRPVHVSPRVLLERASHPGDVVWAGEGAQLNTDLIKLRASELGINFIDEASGAENRMGAKGWAIARPARNLAEHIASLAYKQYERAGGVRPEELHAIYVRPSDAELKEKCLT